MATATTLLQQQQQLQKQEHKIELMCRICAADFKIATEGVPIFNTDQLMDKIKNYLHIQAKLAFPAKINPMCQQKPIKLPPTTVTTPAPLQTAQQQSQQPVAVLSTEDITIFTYQDLKLGQVIKDQELQKLILRALKWNDAGKPIESQLDRLKNASFRAVLNNPDLLRDEDLVQLLGPYLDHGSFAPLDNRSTNMDYSTKMMDQNVTEMEVGVDPDLFFPYDDDESKGLDIEVTKVTKPKKERKKSEPRNKSSKSSISNIIPPGKIRVKCEGLFNMPHKHTSKNAIPMPKPVIVVPTAPKIVQKTISQTTPPIITVPTSAPNAVAATSSATSVLVVAPATSSVSIPKPQIVDEAPPVSETVSNASASTQSAEAPIIVQSTKKIQVPVQVDSAPVPTESLSENKSAVQNTAIETPSTDANANDTPKSAPAEETASKTSNSAVTSAPTSKPTSKTPAATKGRQTRKVKFDQSGPKTRARSIFNTRHKCAVCGKKFSTSGNLKAHVKTHKPKGKFNCDKCGRVFKTQINLQRHKEYHSGEKFSCRTCGRVYPSNSTLKQHEISPKNAIPMPKPVIVVPTAPKIVQKTISQTTPPIITVPTSAPNAVAATSSATSVLVVAPATSSVSIPKPQIVDEAPPVSETVSNASASTQSAEAPIIVQSTKKIQVPVQVDSAPVPTESLSENKSAVQNTAIETPSTDANANDTPKSAPAEETASKTSNSAVTSAPTSKPTSKTPAATKGRQTRKVKFDQSGPKTRARSIFNTRHKCAVCGKKFSTSGNLKAHVKTHKPKGKFNCDKCGRVFKTQINLQRHKEYHSGEKFSCRTCGRVYPSNSTLKQHEISHSNFRPHKCNICLKTFKRSQDLKFHTNQHTGEKPYRCPFCPKSFASSGNCFSHRKRVHSDKSVATPVAGGKRASAVENSKKLLKA